MQILYTVPGWPQGVSKGRQRGPRMMEMASKVSPKGAKGTAWDTHWAPLGHSFGITWSPLGSSLEKVLKNAYFSYIFKLFSGRGHMQSDHAGAVEINICL